MAANFHDLEVVHHAFNTLLTSLTPTQMSSFTEQLRAAPTPSPRTLTPASTPEMNGYGLPSPTSESPVPRDKRSARLKLKQERGKLRPLNAFMAFRCKHFNALRTSAQLTPPVAYYSPQLPGLTQKTKSGLIRTLWEQDQWKHFWTIAAKAYSELRDNHIGQITLEGFLKHTTGLLGVIPAGQYLNIMGWDLVTDTTGNVNLIKMNASAQKQNVPLTTNLSVRDIVEHCYEIGLVSRSARSARGNNRGNGMVMAFAAAPNSPSVGPNSTQSPSSDEEEANELVFAELVSTTILGPRRFSLTREQRPSVRNLGQLVVPLPPLVRSASQSTSPQAFATITLRLSRPSPRTSSRLSRLSRVNIPTTCTSIQTSSSQLSASIPPWSRTTSTRSTSPTTSTSTFEAVSHSWLRSMSWPAKVASGVTQ